jgi:CheY-like chemotaxis protein
VRITTTNVQLGTLRCAFGITEDISERRAAQAEVEKGERRKDRFLALLAHELRNPLAAIRNCVELMAASPQDAAATAKCREVIDRQSRNLARLVDDLLDASRITTGKVTLRKHPVTVGEIVAEALDIAQPAVHALEHDVRTILPPEEIWVTGDKLRLVQALGNVLSNAAKYTPRRGLIQTEVRRDGGDVCISVTDNGPGIAAEDLPYVFNLFQRADESAPAQGLGIGLTITKQLIEMHDGQVSVKSRPGAGSTFEIRLAATSAPALEPDAPHVKEHSASVADILVVEDNIDAAETLHELLSMQGHRVRLAADGASAVRAVNEHAPEIILMDIGLPDTDGRELARRFRAQAHTRNALMIAISGYGEEGEIRKSLDAGFDHHLTKPIDFEALERMLSNSARAPGSGP